ncbi:ATP-dependent helicase, partial [Halobacillus sp. BBL2006]
MDEKISVSVRELVTYVYQTGSIDNRFRSSSSLTEGTVIHQEVQGNYKEDDEKEVYLEHSFVEEGLTIHLQGRCDGILTTEDGPVIDEIKSTSLDINELTEETHPVYWAQAKGYAFMYALRESLDRVQLQLTYVQKQTKEK